MTLNGAIMELVMLSEHPIMPVIFKPSIQKIIETVSECEEPEHKTGRWIHPTFEMVCKCVCGSCEVLCSFCNEPSIDEYNYCPNCGAKMEVEHEAKNDG